MRLGLNAAVALCVLMFAALARSMGGGLRVAAGVFMTGVLVTIAVAMSVVIRVTPQEVVVRRVGRERTFRRRTVRVAFSGVSTSPVTDRTLPIVTLQDDRQRLSLPLIGFATEEVEALRAALRPPSAS